VIKDEPYNFLASYDDYPAPPTRPEEMTMSAQPIDTREAPYRLNSIRCEIVPDPDGYRLHFYCCGKDVRFSTSYEEGEIEREQLNHPAMCEAERNTFPPFKGNPKATSAGEGPTVLQIQAMRSIARGFGEHADDLCVRMLGCEIGELSARARNWFFDYLRARDKKGRGL
jgi:hypothetical protein